MRTQRKARGFTLAQLAALTEYSPGYLSKLESGLVVDPSLACLERVAQALGVDPITLARLKEGGPVAETSQPLSMEQIKIDYEDSRLLVDLSVLDQRTRTFLAEQVRLFKTYLGREAALRIPPPAAGEAGATSGVDSEAERYAGIARACRETADWLVGFGFTRNEEALEAYRTAESILARLGRTAELARVRLGMAWAHQVLGCDVQRLLPDRIRSLHEAEYYHGLIERDLGDGMRIPDLEREVLPTSLLRWAQVIGRLASNTAEHEGLSGADANAVIRSAAVRAAAKRDRSRGLLETWIAELKARAPSNERDRLLAIALHRMGILLRDSENARPAAQRDFSRSEERLVAALNLRWRLAKAAPEETSDTQERDDSRERLAYSHQELGWILQNSAHEDRYERALWQYRVAAHVHPLYNPATNPHLDLLIHSLEANIPEAVRVAVNRRINLWLERCDFAALRYPLLFPEKEELAAPKMDMKVPEAVIP